MSLVGHRIKTLRESLGLSQADLAVKAQTTQPTLSRLEKGQTTEVRFGILVRIADILGVTVDYLVSQQDLNPEEVFRADANARQLVVLYMQLDGPSRSHLLSYVRYLASEDKEPTNRHR